MIEITPQYGRFGLGPFSLGWWNAQQDQSEDYFGWCTISWNDWNIELGEIDQDHPGIYITRYENGEVIRVRTLLELR